MSLRARLRAVWQRIPGTQARAVRRAERDLDQLGRRIVFNARRRVPSRTGALRNSIGYQVSNDGSRARLHVYATAPHARFVHEGTRPHVIRPRTARALRFQIGGRVVFAARVQHPGTRANRFLADAVREEMARQRMR